MPINQPVNSKITADASPQSVQSTETPTTDYSADYSNTQLRSSLSNPDLPLTRANIMQLQKSIGNSAVMQLMKSRMQRAQFVQQHAKASKEETSTSDVSNVVIQLASDNQDHHQNFLYQKMQGSGLDSTNSNFLLAEACAYILDHNSYKKIHTNLPNKYFGVAGSIPASGDPQDYLNLLYGYIQSSGQSTSELFWGPLTSFGTGQGARIMYAKDGHAEGTPTDANTPWMETLKQRKDGSKTLYVMGHLINADLGGPGLDYNYVPLPGRAGWYGANDANGLHSKGIEQIVKSKYALLGNEVTKLQYEVIAVYPRDARAGQTGEMENALIEMGVIETGLGNNANIQLMRLEPGLKKKLKDRIQTIPNLGTMLNAVSSNNYWTKNWVGLKSLLAENLDLWRQEDQMVPKQLNAKVVWEQQGFPLELQLTIPITLPDSLAAPYNSNKVSNHKKSAPVEHKNQFTDYLGKNSDALKAGGERAVTVRGAAFLMDLNEYDRENLYDLFGNIQRNYEIDQLLAGDLPDKKREELLIEKERNSLAAEMLAGDPDLAQIVSSKDAAGFFAKLLKLPSGTQFNLVQDYVVDFNKANGFMKKFSQFTYEGKTPWGTPNKIIARLEKDGHPMGSSAGGDPAWMLKLEERRDSSKTLYVRGHMLNRNLGGAGLDFNMVPLTGREGWYGANNANGMHSNGIEEHVKNLYNNMAGPGEEGNPEKVTNLIYTVEAIFGNHARPQTAKISELTNYYENIIQSILLHLEKSNLNMPDADRKEKYTTLSTQDFVDLANADIDQAMSILLQRLYQMNIAKYGAMQNPLADPLKAAIIANFNLSSATPRELILGWKNTIAAHEYMSKGPELASKEMARSDLRVNFSMPIAALPIKQSSSIIESIKKADHLESVLNAVCATGNYLLEDIMSLQDKMRDNRNLWQTEDTMVPLRLLAQVTWKQHGSDKAGNATIPIVLPSDLAAPYDSTDS